MSLTATSLYEVLTFLPQNDLMKLRLVSSFWKQAVANGWKMRLYELEYLIKSKTAFISSEFDSEVQDLHKTLKDQECGIKDDLSKYLDAFHAKNKLYSILHHKLFYLKNPHRIYSKNIGIIYTIINGSLPLWKDTDFTNRDSRRKFWVEVKKVLKTPDLINTL